MLERASVAAYASAWLACLLDDLVVVPWEGLDDHLKVIHRQKEKHALPQKHKWQSWTKKWRDGGRVRGECGRGERRTSSVVAALAVAVRRCEVNIANSPAMQYCSSVTQISQ